MASKDAARIEELIAKALEGIKRNLTDHVFWEIQRNNDLFRKYVSIVAGNSVNGAVYRKIHSEIALAVKKMTGAKSSKAGKTQSSALNQTFTRFEPTTVKI